MMYMRMRKIKNRSLAFTIIELMVVSSIISVLASTVMSALQSARDSATAVSIKKNMTTYTTAMITHYLDRGYYPRTGNPTDFYTSYCLGKGPCYTDGLPADENAVLMQDLDPYVKGTPAVSSQVFSVYDVDEEREISYQSARYACLEHADNPDSPCPAALLWWATPIKPGATAQDMNAACAIPEARAARGNYLSMACDTGHCLCRILMCPEGSDYELSTHNCSDTF